MQAQVSSLNCRKLKDSIMGHQSTQWKMMEECFMHIHNIGAGYEGAMGYCIPKFNTPDISCITDVKTMRKTGPGYRCRVPHFQCNCTNSSSNKFKTKTPTKQKYKGNNFTDKFHDNKKE